MKNETEEKTGGKGKEANSRFLVIILLFFLTLFIIRTIVDSGFSAIEKFIMAVVFLVATQIFLMKAFGYKSEMGFILLRSKTGLGILENYSKFNFWNFLADVGMVMGYGVLSFIIVKDNRARAFGIFLIICSLFLLPFIYPVALSSISFQQPTSAELDESASSQPFFQALIPIAGYGGVTTAGMLKKGEDVLVKFIFSILFKTQELKSITPGASLLLPGITIDFLPGILAIVVILVFHEGMHGILARLAKIPLNSAGIVLFGALPVGAFVDPDENEVKKTEKIAQQRIFAAGSTGNYILFFVGGILLVMLLLATPYIQDERVFANYNNTLYEVGKLDGYDFNVSNLNDVLEKVREENKTQLAVETANGSLLLNRIYLDKNTSFFNISFFNSRKGGLIIQGNSTILLSPAYREPFGFLNFVYDFLALTFILNFFIASINLVPIPLFDGFRILELEIRDKRAAYFVAFLLLGFFLLNLLPWLF